MKRLLVFTENYVRGGGNRYMIDLVNAVVNHYDELHFASNVGGIFPDDKDRLDKPAVFHHFFFISRARINRLLRFLPKAIQRIILFPFVILEPVFLIFNVFFFILKIKKIKPSCVLSCNGGYPAAQASLAMVLAARVMHIPVVLSIVSMPTPRKIYSLLYEKILDYLVWSSVDIVVVNANIIVQALNDKRGMPIALSRVVYNGLKDNKLANVPRRDSKETFVIGCLARMDVSKGVLHLFDAFAELAKTRPQLRLVLAGEGDASGQLQYQIDSLGLQGQIQLLGHYSGDVSALLDTFDIYVLPSLWEGLPYSIIESMRSACVIVATRVGGIPEAITDGKEGLLISPGSTSEIVSAIERLMADPEMCRSLANNARLKYENELSLKKMHCRAREVLGVQLQQLMS